MTFNDYLFLAKSDELISQRFERTLRDACTKSTEENITGIRHLHDGVILIQRPQCFVKMLSYSNLSSLLGVKRQLEKLASQQRPL